MNFKWLWRDLEFGKRPERAVGIKNLDYKEFSGIMEGDARSAADIIQYLYEGNIFLIRGAFSRDWMIELKRKVVEWRNGKPSEFHKMLYGCPDFHRVIDHETGLKYAFRQCKHSAYFYNWNDDPLKIFDDVYERWSPVKELMGLSMDEYRHGSENSAVVDRVQVVRYPPSAGYLEPHSDPYKHQRLFLSGYMSKRGEDYEGGGFYLVGKNDEKIEVEDQIDVGDIAIGYATVMHGVAPCVGECDWSKDDGRWFLSMYSNATDYNPDRHTGSPARVSIPGTLPEGVI